MTDIRQKLAAIFQGEHAEHLEHIRSILALLENASDQNDSRKTGGGELDEAFRRAHSLKGAARAVDLEAVEGLASGLETVFSRVREGTLALDQRADARDPSGPRRQRGLRAGVSRKPDSRGTARRRCGRWRSCSTGRPQGGAGGSADKGG